MGKTLRILNFEKSNGDFLERKAKNSPFVIFIKKKYSVKTRL